MINIEPRFPVHNAPDQAKSPQRFRVQQSRSTGGLPTTGSMLTNGSTITRSTHLRVISDSPRLKPASRLKPLLWRQSQGDEPPVEEPSPNEVPEVQDRPSAGTEETSLFATDHEQAGEGIYASPL